jgi:hypothetical protein
MPLATDTAFDLVRGFLALGVMLVLVMGCFYYASTK